MIAYIQGTLAEKFPTHALIDVRGIGYEIHIPLSTFEQLPETGTECRLMTHFHVREDIQQLYGFHTAAEKEMFLILIAVSGIGPKSALGILSGISIEDFRQAVLREDHIVLSSLPGIGKKTAQRLIVELKEKISKITPVSGGKVTPKTASSPQLTDEAVMALMSLGYSRPLAEKAVLRYFQENPGDSPSLQELIKRSLRLLTNG